MVLKRSTGNLALQIAVENSLTAIILILLNVRFDPSELNISTLTPIDLAVIAWTHGSLMNLLPRIWY